MTSPEVVLRPESKRSHLNDSRRSSIFTLAFEDEDGCLPHIFACRQNLATERGKRLQTVRIWILCSVSLVAILVVAIVDVQHYTNEEFNNRQSRNALRQWECLDPILHYLSVEGALDAQVRVILENLNRTSTSTNSSPLTLLLSNASTEVDSSTPEPFTTTIPTTPTPPIVSPAIAVLLSQLYIFRNRTDTALADSCAENLFSESVSSNNTSSFNKKQLMDRLEQHRCITSRKNKSSYFYRDIRRELFSLGSTLHVTSGYLAVHSSRSSLASEMELVTRCLGPSDHLPSDFIYTVEALHGSAHTLLQFAVDTDASVLNRVLDEVLTDELYTDILYLRRLDVLSMCNTSVIPDNFSMDPYFDTMTEVLTTLKRVNDDVLQDLIQVTEERLDSIRARLVIEIVATLCVVLFFPLVLNSVGNMTGWIHDYAHRLKERTDELKQEKKMTESLLYQLLPRKVANQIRAKQQVCAESFDAVTIFFSDIVGFTRISAHINPIEVVGMLNDLYSCFDGRIDVYDVYKVETIGDAYMVASGCPERNGDKHVKEIATMSIDLRSAVKQVHVPRSPSIKLQVRIGIHTGPCVAGVVGIKMPRYCLFGDTVNTASRMESNGLPNKIHLSGECYEALSKDTTYVMEKRGEVQIKGKGLMTTYWLIERADFSEVNDSAVCTWKPKKRKKVALDAGSQDFLSVSEYSSAANSSISLNSTIKAAGDATGDIATNEVKRLPRIPGQVPEGDGAQNEAEA
ncbi:adenylate cyclase, germination specific-like [Lytechinus pictus]|uniref:adenylate cyclase, germination specific-like n=1 Tax=Lytechinus pictus TaxID=7653 RepID=UPI0030BA14BF